MREDPMISESAMKEAEMIIQRIKKWSNELLLK
jgi:hypothetical protein